MKQFKYMSVIIAITFLFQIQFAFGQKAKNVSQISITVSNLEEAIRFYEGVLPFKTIKKETLKDAKLLALYGFKEKSMQIKRALLQLGSEQIELIEFSGTENRAIPSDSHSNDLWFQHIAIVVNNMEEAYKLLRKNRVKHVSTSPQTLPDYIPAAAGIKAFYFRDPDGHNLEIIYFPKGKGDPRWQEDSEFIFRGIDHTAIGISNTEESLNFYQNILGLKLGGQSENYGPEQEHLNQVFGARLLISGLRAESGVGIEFLEYIAPPGGRTYPSNSQVSDLWHWHTSIEVSDLKAYHQRLNSVNTTFISDGIIDLSNSESPYNQALMLRDPDGHALLLYEKK